MMENSLKEFLIAISPAYLLLLRNILTDGSKFSVLHILIEHFVARESNCIKMKGKTKQIYQIKMKIPNVFDFFMLNI